MVGSRQVPLPQAHGAGDASAGRPRPPELHRSGAGHRLAGGHHRGPHRRGRLYLCATRDPFSNRTLGRSIDSRMKVRLVVAAIEMAVTRRGDDAGCILHSHRARQFRALKMQRTLTRYRMVGSMRRSAQPATTPQSNRFFTLLQRNVLDRGRWDTRDELRIAIGIWIERTYDRRRRQAALRRLKPVEVEVIMTRRPPNPTCHRVVQQSRTIFWRSSFGFPARRKGSCTWLVYTSPVAPKTFAQRRCRRADGAL